MSDILDRLRESSRAMVAHGYYHEANLLELAVGEIERLRAREAELHGQLMRMIDRWEDQRVTIEKKPVEITIIEGQFHE